jgi:hypothetical protein
MVVTRMHNAFINPCFLLGRVMRDYGLRSNNVEFLVIDFINIYGDIFVQAAVRDNKRDLDC